MDRAQVLERLEPIMDLQTRQVQHSPRTRVMVSPDAVALRPGGGARTVEFTAEGVRSLVNYCGLPESLVGKLQVNTLGNALTELLGTKERYSLLMKEGRVVDVTKPTTYRNINPERVLNTVERAITHAEFHRVLTLPNHTAQLEIVGEERRAVARGDLIRAGAMIAFSPIGASNPMVQSYVLRLACTNGATSTDILRQFSFGGGEGDNIWHWFRQSVRDAYRALNGIVDRYRQMRSEHLQPEDRAMVLEAMIKQARLPTEAAETVRTLAIESPPENSYDVMNLITRASSHLLQDGAHVRRAQQAAAEYASEAGHRRLCPVCHHER